MPAEVNCRILLVLHVLNITSDNMETVDVWWNYENRLKRIFLASEDIHIIELCIIINGWLNISLVKINDILKIKCCN